MARDSVAVQALVLNSGTVSAGQAITAANGQTIPTDGVTRKLVIQVKNTGGTNGTVSIEPGVYPPAFQQFGGSIVLTVPANSERIFVVEAARVLQADQSIYVDFTPSNFTGSTYVYQLPQGL